MKSASWEQLSCSAPFSTIFLGGRLNKSKRRQSMSSNQLLDFSWWGLALQLASAVVITGFVEPWPRCHTSETARGGRRDRRSRRHDGSHFVAHYRASHLAPDPDVHAHTLPTNPAEETIRVGEAASLSEPSLRRIPTSSSSGVRNLSDLSESDGQ